MPERRAAADGLPVWPSQDHDAGRWPSHDRHGRADGSRRADQWRLVRSLCDVGPDSRTAPQCCGHHGQPLQPQARGCEREDRSDRCNPSLPPVLQSRLQSYREGVLLAQGHPAQSGERTVRGPWDLIGRLVDIFQPDERANYFTSCGYKPE